MSELIALLDAEKEARHARIKHSTLLWSDVQRSGHDIDTGERVAVVYYRYLDNDTEEEWGYIGYEH